MKTDEFSFTYKVYDSIDELEKGDAELLQKAIAVTSKAYAPYSHFYVGAVARLTSGAFVHGTNQENASYPVGICAERVLLAAASSAYPDIPIEALAVSYQSNNVRSDHPIAPCGMCRQALQEFENRMKHPVKIILGGSEGKIYIIPSVTNLLPFSFDASELNVTV